MPPSKKAKPSRAIVEAQIDDNLRKIFEEDSEDDVPSYLQDLVNRLGEIDDAETPAQVGTAQDDEVNR